MKKAYLLKLSVVVVCLVGFLSLSLSAQEASPSAALLKMKKLGTKGFTGIMNTPAMLATNKRGLTIFSGDINQNTYKATLRSISLKSKGGVKSSGKVVYPDLMGDEGFAAAPLWLGDTSSGYGLFFLLRFEGEELKIVKLDVAKFDEYGKITEDFKTIAEFNAGKNARFNSISLGSGVNESGAGIVVGINKTDTNTYDNSGLAYFLETDLMGEVTAKKRSIVIPNGGKWRSPTVYSPVWNGASWLVPLRVSKSLKEGNYGGSVRTGAIVMVANVKGTKGSIKPATIYDLTSKPDYITHVDLLPNTQISVAGAKAVNLYVLYQYQKSMPSGSFGRDEYIYYLQKLTTKGKKSGARVALKMPEWNIKMIKEDGCNYFNQEYISAARDTGNNVLAFALTRTMERYKGGTYNYEQECDLVKLNLGNGQITQVSRNNSFVKGVYSQPVIAMFKGKIALIASMWDKSTQSWTASSLYYYALK